MVTLHLKRSGMTELVWLVTKRFYTALKLNCCDFYTKCIHFMSISPANVMLGMQRLSDSTEAAYRDHTCTSTEQRVNTSKNVVLHTRRHDLSWNYLVCGKQCSTSQGPKPFSMSLTGFPGHVGNKWVTCPFTSQPATPLCTYRRDGLHKDESGITGFVESMAPHKNQTISSHQ
jgi:hypothetical protein